MTGSGWFLSAASLLLATGCTMDQPPATVTPTVPQLVIVTATAGVPGSPPPALAARRYVVQEGDSLSQIADRFDVTETAIIQANDLSDPDHILVGQELVIPAPEP